MSDEKPKGLRFEVYPNTVIHNVLYGPDIDNGREIVKSIEWEWQLVGAEGPVCKSVTTWDTEREARAALAANKGRMGNAKRCKVITVEHATEVEIVD